MARSAELRAERMGLEQADAGIYAMGIAPVVLAPRRMHEEEGAAFVMTALRLILQSGPGLGEEREGKGKSMYMQICNLCAM
jgi:hypothetical protein